MMSVNKVLPIRLRSTLTILFDEKLDSYKTIWLAASHRYYVFTTMYFQIRRIAIEE